MFDIIINNCVKLEKCSTVTGLFVEVIYMLVTDLFVIDFIYVKLNTKKLLV